jgi:hypothetical protein
MDTFPRARNGLNKLEWYAQDLDGLEMRSKEGFPETMAKVT